MAGYAFETVDVFTTVRFGGNPLAVLTDARGLDDGAMQRVAREFNLSETTFVFPPEDAGHTAKVRIFTPVTELPFAGHPNVGTALVLAARMPSRPERMVFEEKAGLVPILFDWSGASARATLEAPQVLALEGRIPAEVIARCVGLEPCDIVTARHEPIIAGVGTPFAIAEVTTEGLGRASPDAGAMREAARSYPVRPLGFPLHLHAATEGRLRTRMFSPLSGIPEDPATGSANVALAALLLSLGDAAEISIEIEQGVEMGRPSLLFAGARRGPDGIRAWVGGSAVPVSNGVIEV